MSGALITVVTVRIESGPVLDCAYPANVAVHVGDHCILQYGDVTEYCLILSIREVHQNELLADDVQTSIVRLATLVDTSRHQENVRRAHMAIKVCRRIVADEKLDIRIVQLRYSFDQSRIFVVFSASERVDFRTMIRKVSSELNVRVEMKQIGVRDEAAMIGGMGPCGRKMCCCVWIKRFESVNVRMAKVQGLSLNPATISGMCGRLKCCMRYEHSTYKELDAQFPRDGALVALPDGNGRVAERNLLEGTVAVVLADGARKTYRVDEVERISGGGNERKSKRAKNSTSKRTEPESTGEAGAGDIRGCDA